MTTPAMTGKDRAMHTPGPWQAKNEHEWDEIIGNIDGPDAGAFHYTHICSVDMHDLRTPEQHANARLIAAAPELLAALIAMERKASKQNWNDAYPEQLEAARAAIAKATGATP